MDPDPKHPERWRKVRLCQTADRGFHSTFKEVILDACAQRNDDWAKQVEVRLQGAISDLHAADGRYHADCSSKFMTPRAVKAAAAKSVICEEEKLHFDDAYEEVLNAMKCDRSHIWSSTQLYKHYLQNNGNQLTRSALVQKISEYFGKDLLILSASGVANILVFQSTAHSVLKIEEDCDDDDHVIRSVGKKIMKETLSLPKTDNEYFTRLDKDSTLDEISPTLLSLLGNITEKLDSTLPAILIGNIITSIIKKQPTTLQIALGVLLRSKSLIEQFYKFGVTCSYDEVLRFKQSAAVASAKSSNMGALSYAKHGLVQAVADNFDANISSQNGLRSTHALALLLTQNRTLSESSAVCDKEENITIKRLKKTEMKNALKSDIPVQSYKGPKKPDMPELEAKRSILPLKVLAQQNIVLRRAKELDFVFLKTVINDITSPEYGGFNTRMSRQQGQTPKPATVAVYTPLIDMVPSDPDTMMTAMVEAQNLTKLTGQTYTVFTNDQQLYKVAVNIVWVYPELFPEFIPRLGGMHMLMSFVGSVGSLMANSGLEDVMKAAFGGVPRMLTGKNFPQNTRALRMVAEEVLRGVLTSSICSDEDLLSHLDSKASSSRTAKLWIDNLIKPVFIMMLFVRSEREADWALHLSAVNEMLPYFFAAGHFNYARYGLYYLRSMERLPNDVLERFLRGEHVMRHNAGIWNGIWSDMYIETTFMRYGHSPGGLTGITLSPSAVKRWALSLHICNRLTNDVVEITERNRTSVVESHKEEMPARIKSDLNDRKNIKKKLETCIDPLNPGCLPDNIVNIVSGRISPQSVNADKSVIIGRQQMTEYEASWPQGFNDPLSKKVTTMSISKKQITIGSTGTFDTELIYSRVMGLIHTRQVDLENIFEHELAPVPTSMFKENGDIRSGVKAGLKGKLQVEQSARILLPAEVIIIDGCAMFWVLHWPTSGTVEDYINIFVEYVLKKLHDSDTYVVFDRYYDYSIKSSTRNYRAGKQASRKHQLNLKTPLPPQKVVLTVTDNKKQLIDILCEQLLIQGQISEACQHHKLVVTGSNPVPQEIYKENCTPRQDIRSTHEEADIIIAQQVIAACQNGSSSIKVVSDDTDVFILLLHYYHTLLPSTCQLLMEGTSSKRSVIDIKATVLKHAKIVPQLMAAHAITGCDTVAYLWGIGKATALKALLAGHKLDQLGQLNVEIDEVVAEATKFVAACYGSKTVENMSKVRFEIWRSKTSKKKITKPPPLKSLPPTSEAFAENVKRAHLQVALWKAASEPDPPDLCLDIHGWMKDEVDKSLTPIMVPPNVAPAPPEILQMICCGCSTEHPCSTARCGCAAAQLACSIFCKCEGGELCSNPWTKHISSDAEDSDVEEPDKEDEVSEV
jgi:hypothetical protein